MVYRQDNRRKSHRVRYTVLGIVIGIILVIVGLYDYDNYKKPILDNVKQTTQVIKVDIPKLINPVKIDPNSSSTITHVNNQLIQTENPPLGNNNSPIDNTSSLQINMNELEQEIHDKINDIRAENNLKPLIYNNELATIAREHSKDMVFNNYFDHTSLDGKTLQNRIFEKKIPCFVEGENIQENYLSTPDLLNSVIQTWMTSSEHRDNILSEFFHSEGIGIYINDNSLLITEDFC